MPNQLLSVRIPPEIDELLPSDRGQRSKAVIEALRQYLTPSNPEDDLSMVKQRLLKIEQELSAIRARN